MAKTNPPSQKQFPLDNSAILHLAVLRPGKANIFRFWVTLTESVRPELLQKALDTVTPQFPVLVAGIRGNFFHCRVVPVEEPPKVRPDTETLGFMTWKDIRQCAMRVLYRKDQISVEFFHSLTDGYGALVFLKSLLAEYFRLSHGIELSQRETELAIPRFSEAEETVDSFLTYAGKEKAALNNTRSFLPGEDDLTEKIHTTTGIFDVRPLLGAAHRYGVSLTTFLTAVMAQSLMEIQARRGKKHRPIQIMVPINLRNLFPSKTLRNFSLYAMPQVRPEDIRESFENLVRRIDAQLRKHFTKEHLQSMMTTNVSLDRNPLMRRLPWAVKCAGLRLGYHFFGGRNSSLSLSNLGQLQFPAGIQPYIQQVGCFLSPRINSAYNCGVISNQGKLYFTFSGSSPKPELELVFFRKLCEMGCVPELETDSPVEDFQILPLRVRKVSV